jgi:hypothetical protein
MECQCGRLCRKNLFLGAVRKTIRNQCADHRGSFEQTLRFIFGKVGSPEAFRMPPVAGEAACGTV